MSKIESLPSICGYDKLDLSRVLQSLGVADKKLKMRVNQLWGWLYTYGVKDFSSMTTISKELREELSLHYTIDRPVISDKQVSQDGTRKYLFKLHDGYEIETVYIPGMSRGTICISSQVGCTLSCSFCHTGTQRLVRNLESHEIVSQLVSVRDDLEDWVGQDSQRNHDTRRVTNIVMMGMGEPLYNTDNVIRALKVMTDGDGLSLSRRRVTLSTSGIVPDIHRIGEETGVMLAISLHAVGDELRDELVPINKKYPLAELLDACRTYPGVSNARRITFEYVMLDGINDSDDDAYALVKLLAKIPSKINLIPFNPWKGSPYECSSWDRIEVFASILNRAGYASPIRMPRGRDIMAACGQLKSESVKASASRVAKVAEQ